MTSGIGNALGAIIVRGRENVWRAFIDKESRILKVIAAIFAACSCCGMYLYHMHQRAQRLHPQRVLPPLTGKEEPTEIYCRLLYKYPGENGLLNANEIPEELQNDPLIKIGAGPIRDREEYLPADAPEDPLARRFLRDHAINRQAQCRKTILDYCLRFHQERMDKVKEILEKQSKRREGVHHDNQQPM